MLLPPRHFYPSRSQFYTLRVDFRLPHFEAKPKLPSQWNQKNFDSILKHWLPNCSPKDKHETCQGADLQSNKRKPAFCNKCFNPILPLIVLLKASVTYEPPCFINCNCNVNTCIRIFCNQNLVISRQAIMVVWCKLIGPVSGIAHAEEIPGNGASFRGKIFLFWVRILFLNPSTTSVYFLLYWAENRLDQTNHHALPSPP